LVHRFRIGAAAARADVVRARNLGLDVAAQRAMARNAALDRGEPVGLGIEPMEIAVEDDRRCVSFAGGKTLDLA
jgi:hypothetical protein